MFILRQSAPSRHTESGLTLIELLVSLVILGFVVTVMSGAFFQVGQVVRIAEGVNGQFQPRWLHQNALNDLVGNLVIPDGDDRPFTGDADSFEGYSLSLPRADWGEMQKFRVALVPRDGGRDLTVAAGDEKPIVIASWEVPVQFEYVAVNGAPQSMWPPFGKSQDRLPSGVVVRNVNGEQMVQLTAAFSGSREGRPDPAKSLEAVFGLNLK